MNRTGLADLLYEGAADELVERIETAVFFVGPSGAPVSVNRAGREALRSQRVVTVRNGRFEPKDVRAVPSFLLRLTKAASAWADRDREPQDQTLLVGAGEQRALLTFLPLRSGSGTSHGIAVAVFLKPLSPDVFSLASLGIAMSWTTAETRLAEALLQGSTLSDLADGWRLSRETLKSEVRGLYAKTGVSRQSEFVATVLGLLSHRIG